MEKVNEIMVDGRVVYIGFRGNRAFFTMYVKKDREYYPQFFCDKKTAESLVLRERYVVYGHAKIFIFRKDEKTAPSQVLIADKVEKKPTLTEKRFGVRGKFFSGFDATAYFTGTIRNVRSEGAWTRLSLDLEAPENVRSRIQLSMKNTRKGTELKDGDHVCCVCNLETKERIFDGERKKYIDFLVQDVAVIPE